MFVEETEKETHLGSGPNFAISDTYSRPETALSAVKDMARIKAVFLLLKKLHFSKVYQ